MSRSCHPPAYCKPLSPQFAKVASSVNSDNLTVIRSAFRPLAVPRKAVRWLPPFDGRDIMIKVVDNCATMEDGLWYIPTAVRDALCDMAILHSSLSGHGRVRGRVAVLRGTPCPRWHVDKVQLRGICALLGPGCVVKHEGKAMHLQTGDAAFIGGATSDADWDDAVWHRSPLVSDNAVRMVVQTDC